MTDRSLKLISLYWLNCTTDDEVENEVAQIYYEKYKIDYTNAIKIIFKKKREDIKTIKRKKWPF